jgi:hypothetical protein
MEKSWKFFYSFPDGKPERLKILTEKDILIIY